MPFVEATKESCKLRAAVFGPSGSGKTYTSLRIATGIGGKIGVIDSERRRARKYSDRFKFIVNDLEAKDITAYTQAMHEAAQAGIECLIIDSLSHSWDMLLQEIDRLAASRFRGNSFQAWSVGTPKQMQFIDTILAYPGHVICTMRSKTEWLVEKDEQTGKSKPTRVGLAPKQGKDIEYEFDFLLEMALNHSGNVLKDNSGKYQDQVIELPGEDLGRDLALWLSDGAPRVEQPKEPANGNGHKNGTAKPPIENPLFDATIRKDCHVAMNEKLFASNNDIIAWVLKLDICKQANIVTWDDLKTTTNLDLIPKVDGYLVKEIETRRAAIKADREQAAELAGSFA